MTGKVPLALLTRYVTPAEIRRAGKTGLVAHLKRTPVATPPSHGEHHRQMNAQVAVHARRPYTVEV